jgi:hypothetical protein
MPIIDNPSAVAFSRMTRDHAKLLYDTYRASKHLTDIYFGQNMGALIPNDGDYEVNDGFVGHGYPAIHGNDVINIVTRAIENVDGMEANGHAVLNTVIAVLSSGE